MIVLLDTHIFIRSLTDEWRLSAEARKVLANEENVLLLSVASLWEATIKISLGNLQVPGGSVEFLVEKAHETAVNILPVQPNHLTVLQRLPQLHRDPFDRMLVAQALAERISLLTADRSLGQYGVLLADA